MAVTLSNPRYRKNYLNQIISSSARHQDMFEGGDVGHVKEILYYEFKGHYREKHIPCYCT
ncbi:hypothetical protein VEZ01S_16_00320 [Vibrio ezurae NBRC 102218]|uniref:Uncharacterized protein n=1 Tax=Vibrio ezurae NBRC 102218 TaxID=1219080 RepID=U3CN06_9VIBR|nr:hypothetical protein VEZ01S_16_00320 [Vibrio ezurae NBRC 102218]